jgi:hypothetical protein
MLCPHGGFLDHSGGNGDHGVGSLLAAVAGHSLASHPDATPAEPDPVDEPATG